MKISLKEAAQYLKKGEVIASSTDTVWGFLAPFNNAEAIEKIYTLKERPETKPLILLLPRKEEVVKYTSFIPPLAKKVMEKLWPGPLTLVLPANQEAVPSYLLRGGSTIAIRVPSHPLLSPLLALVGPLVAPSLNKSGEKVLETLEEVEKNFGVELPFLYDGTPPNSSPSTLVEFKENSFTILREGAITKSLLISSLEG